MQKIQDHFLEDIYRLKDGILLVVHKYNSKGYFSESLVSKSGTKIKKKKLQGISKTYQFQEDVKLFDGTILPKGTYLKESIIAEPVTNPSEFTVELKVSGGFIKGNIALHRNLYREIDLILSSYSSFSC